jgi:hypothetical protein
MPKARNDYWFYEACQNFGRSLWWAAVIIACGTAVWFMVAH